VSGVFRTTRETKRGDEVNVEVAIVTVFEETRALTSSTADFLACWTPGFAAII